MTNDDRIEALALLRGVNTSLLHLLATAPIYALTPIAEAYKNARTAIRILEFRSAGDHEQSAADAVAFRHGDINQICGGIRDAGEFTQPPNCVHESIQSTNVGHVEKVDSKHPMHAVALEMAEAAIPKRRSESAWSVTWPGDAPRESAASITEYQTPVGN